MRTTPSRMILRPFLRGQLNLPGLLPSASWEELKSAAVSTELAPVVAYQLRPYVSADRRQWCDSILIANWRRHDRNIRQLDEALRLMDAAGVASIVLKGPILGRRHFQPPFLRKASKDIDLAVRDSDLERAVAALEVAGYRPTMSPAQVRLTSHHLEMAHSVLPNVELHTRLSKTSLAIPADDLFERAEEHVLPTGRRAKVPSASEELVSLLVHLIGDRFSSFFHLYEFRMIWLAATSEIRMEVIAQCRKHKISAFLTLADAACFAYWGEHLTCPSDSIPCTWLQRRLNEDLVHAMEENARRRSRTLGDRLTGRWLDLHLTESPREAWSALSTLVRVAIRELAGRRWRTIHRA